MPTLIVTSAPAVGFPPQFKDKNKLATEYNQAEKDFLGAGKKTQEWKLKSLVQVPFVTRRR